MAPAVRDALSALELGHDRRARSLLQAHLGHTRDLEAMKLLGDVLHGLGDLPGAGAVWFAIGAKGPAVDEAVSAWRTKHGDDFAKMWNSIPAGIRTAPLPPRLAALKAKADQVEATRRIPEPVAEPKAAPGAKATEPEATAAPQVAERREPSRRSDLRDQRPKEVEKTGFDAAKIIGWVLAALFVVCAVVGLITILQWIVPGS